MAENEALDSLNPLFMFRPAWVLKYKGDIMVFISDQSHPDHPDSYIGFSSSPGWSKQEWHHVAKDPRIQHPSGRPGFVGLQPCVSPF